jgi:ankyrin repeat protein
MSYTVLPTGPTCVHQYHSQQHVGVLADRRVEPRHVRLSDTVQSETLNKKSASYIPTLLVASFLLHHHNPHSHGQRDKEREMAGFDLGQLLLHTAEEGDASQVRSLIGHNANVNQGDNYNYTPLHLACMHGHGEVACMLIDHNANVNQCNNYNMTPLHMACSNGHVEVACMLIDHNANLNQCNNNNNTPLHWACHNGHVEVACMLIDHGADINIINVCCLDSVTD